VRGNRSGRDVKPRQWDEQPQGCVMGIRLSRLPCLTPIANIMEISQSLGEAGTSGPFVQVGTVAVVCVGEEGYPHAVLEVRE
jgi:hypothetical protein